MTRGLFVTGTDTAVGKTVVSALLLRALVQSGWRAVGMKPVAAGVSPGESVNADVRALIAGGNVEAPLADVNPYSFAPAIAPELAARSIDAIIDLDIIEAAYARLAARANAIVVEGAGGALVPLSPRTDMLDIPARLCLPVLLVVGLRIGCQNHALLSAQAIHARGLRLAGWVANAIDPTMHEPDANIAVLQDRLPAPLAAHIAWRVDGAPAFTDPDATLASLGLDLRPQGSSRT